MQKDRGLVSVIMLSRNSSQFVEESIRSVMIQTYTNWELIIVDDNSKDGTVEKMMELRGDDKRIIISQAVYERGCSVNRNVALKSAYGKWIAFLDAGDVWHPEKLERQIAFMEENDYHFSYTCYNLIDDESKSRGYIVGGKDHITHQDMLKCCWPKYLTVMYDREKIGLLQVKGQNINNDYALWLDASDKCDCYLLKENLASYRTHWGLIGKFIMTNKFKWRYDCYRLQEDLGVIMSFFYTLRNAWYGVYKWMKYVKRVR